MAVSVWDPFTALARLDTEFDELMRRAWGGGPHPGRRPAAVASGYVPAVEMVVDGSDVVITFELPGVDIDNDVDIEVTEGRLAISGQRRDYQESSEGGGKVLVRELQYGGFRREFALPSGITAEQVDATYDRGMLSVRIRDLAKQPETHKIPVRGAATSEHKQVTSGEKKH